LLNKAYQSIHQTKDLAYKFKAPYEFSVSFLQPTAPQALRKANQPKQTEALNANNNFSYTLIFIV